MNNVSLNKNNIISENKKIYEIDEIKDITSNAFKALLDKKEGFTVDKILEMLEYYLRLIYGKISKEIIYYQEKLEDDKSVEYINNYFLKKNFIKKKDFSYSIRIFISSHISIWIKYKILIYFTIRFIKLWLFCIHII